MALIQCCNDKILPLLPGTRGLEESDRFFLWKSSGISKQRLSNLFNSFRTQKLKKRRCWREKLAGLFLLHIRPGKTAGSTDPLGAPPAHYHQQPRCLPPPLAIFLQPRGQGLMQFLRDPIVWSIKPLLLKRCSPCPHLPIPSSTDSPVASSGGCTTT